MPTPFKCGVNNQILAIVGDRGIIVISELVEEMKEDCCRALIYGRVAGLVKEKVLTKVCEWESLGYYGRRAATYQIS